MEVAFINENTLGHASYLLPFVQAFRDRPELGIQPHLIDATPLPPQLERRANWSIRGLRRWGLDFHNARWRLTVSRHAREQLDGLRARQPIDAVVVNTQSVALALLDVACELPVFVCLDATFAQLARSRWFAPNRVSRWLLPVTLAPIRERERSVLRRAARLLPWSNAVATSLLEDYQLAGEKISVLPPSIELPPRRTRSKPAGARPQILFVGGDFLRKGGPLLLECFRQRLADRCELHLVTRSDVPPERGVFVHHGLAAPTAAWRARWEEADIFVFPSTLETFGIVLVEALAFQVPVVSADVGAACELLAGGKAGWLPRQLTVDTLASCVHEVLDTPEIATVRADRGRMLIEAEYDIAKNAERLVDLLRTGVRCSAG
ncbi:MAG: glycosyltransferase family 4 protein [Limisphaerales bacterium]